MILSLPYCFSLLGLVGSLLLVLRGLIMVMLSSQPPFCIIRHIHISPLQNSYHVKNPGSPTSSLHALALRLPLLCSKHWQPSEQAGWCHSP